MLQRMEAQDEAFESRLRALEGWRAETGRRREEDFDVSSRAGGRGGGGGDVTDDGRGETNFKKPIKQK